MTTDELRAKFEAHFSQPPYEWSFARYTERQAWPGSYARYNVQCAWESYQAAHASRDAEVEALKRDAERYRAIRQAFVEEDEGFIEKITDVLRGRDCTAAEFDTAIDVAREKQP